MSKNQENQLEEELAVDSRDSDSEHICYTPKDILEEAKKENIKEKYSLGFGKEVPPPSPPFLQAPPRRYTSNYSSEQNG